MRNFIAALAALVALFVAAPVFADDAAELSDRLGVRLSAAVERKLSSELAHHFDEPWQRLQDDTATRMDCSAESSERVVCAVRLTPRPALAAVAPPAL